MVWRLRECRSLAAIPVRYRSASLCAMSSLFDSSTAHSISATRISSGNGRLPLRRCKWSAGGRCPRPNLGGVAPVEQQVLRDVLDFADLGNAQPQVVVERVPELVAVATDLASGLMCGSLPMDGTCSCVSSGCFGCFAIRLAPCGGAGACCFRRSGRTSEPTARTSG